jgi:aldehyde:ferredoxin oxidoreductase
MYGFQGKILVVDVSRNKASILEKSETYYKKYIGGALLCAALYEELTEGIESLDAFSPENPIIFATGPLAGQKVCGATRVNVMSMAPETTGIYLSQAGGDFGPALKRAGFDALAVTGTSGKPVLLCIDNDHVEFMNAEAFWGEDRLTAYKHITEEIGTDYCIASIGPAGENRVRQANIMFEPDHYAGRGGLGAVMGAKNIKAIAVKGEQKTVFKNQDIIEQINKSGGKRFITAVKNSPGSFMGILRNLGTIGLLEVNQKAGNLPTRNFRSGYPASDNASYVFSQKNAAENYVGKKAPCKNCYVACKKRSKANTEYSALAEYESIATLGPNIGMEDDIDSALEASELCNRLGLDTISTGNIIAWMMDCFENKILSEKDISDSIAFGDGQKAMDLIKSMAYRRTELGNLLADGIERAAEQFSSKTKPFLRFAKGVGMPAHMPRKKPGVGFGYLHGPNAGDHMKLEHDWIASDAESLAAFQLNIQSDADSLDQQKIEIARTTQVYYAAIDTLSLCMFIFGPGNVYSFEEITDMLNGATGFSLTFPELMEIGERAIQLQRKLFLRFGGTDEEFLSFLADEIPEGPSKGAHIKETDFLKARQHYYTVMGWDERGMVLKETLERLGLS